MPDSTDAKKMETPRIKFTINEQWNFSLNANEEFYSKNFNDSDWERINLPHTWNKEDAFDERKQYYRGSGFYRKKFSLNPEWKNKKIFLFFEGANQVADIYVNGKPAGQHKGGYTAFAFDITSLIDFPGGTNEELENLLAVKVDNSHNPDIPPLNADFTFYGGIYRDVWLIITETVHINILDYASPGIFIDTPEISGEKAKVRIRGTVVNEKNITTEVEVVSRILDVNNYEVAVLKSPLKIKNNSKGSFEKSGIIENPNLWSPENPYLYKVKTEIFEKNILVDEITNPLGVRWFSFSQRDGFPNSDSGFFLNDKPLKLFGTNRHQDYDGLGNALPDQLHRNDVKIIKENGFNFLRLSHYPQDLSVLESANELGLIIWEEIPIVNKITVSSSFTENCKTMLREMIRQHYNHPSILMWGYMNEVMLVKPEIIPEGYYEEIVKLAKELEAIVKEEDKSRATTMASSYGEIENGTGIDEISDIIGMNLYFGWYYETLGTFGEFLDGYHKRHPDRPVIISEYGAGSDERIHSFKPEAFDFSTEYQQIFHEKTFPQILEREYILGSAVWNQFDFGSDFRQDSKPSINQKGLYYFNRKPKDISYYYKAKLSGKPLLHIVVEDWKYRICYKNGNSSQPLKIYSNLKKVSVFLNDSLIGNFNPGNCIIILFLQLQEGINMIKAKGEYKGETVEAISELFYKNSNSFFDSDEKTLAINMGAQFEYIDGEKTHWIPGENDNIKLKYSEGNPIKTHRKILNTDNEPIYQTALEGIESFYLNVPDGNYSVQLYFSEIHFDKPAQRIFNVYVNDVPVFYNLDLIKEYERYRAVNRTTNIHSKNDEGIVIRFEAVKGISIINGIRFEKIN